MLLAIDAGNTNLVFAVYDGRTKRGSWRISTDTRRTSDEYAVWLTHLMGLVGLTPADIGDAILASVVPAANFHLLRLCRDHFGREPLVVGDPGTRLDIEALIDNPEEAGADRLVNAIAARAIYPVPLVVVDIGTGTTFDVVDDDGNFYGGIIAPGPAPALEALHRIAAKLPKIDIARPKRVIGKGTVGAMQSGIFWGYVSLIEGLLTRIQAEYGKPMTVIATGGLAALFEQATDMIQHTDEELTLRGLVLIHEQNRRA